MHYDGLRNIYSLYLQRSIDLLKLVGNSEFDRKRRELLECDILGVINKEALFIINNYIEPLIKDIKDALRSTRFTYILEIEATTKSRLLINMASGLGQTVFEVGINIHPLFSIPYIPSSSIKGALRSYIHRYSREKERVFGNTEMMGDILILDAYPIKFEKRLLDGEITTPIYGSDDTTIEEHKAKPNPVIYPCIAKGVTFKFIVAVRNHELRDEITNYFYNMLKEGIGAKTLLGYGELV